MRSILKRGEKKSKKDVDRSAKRKSAKFDEMNIVATLHPADKDYGHMKIDEPKTPYSYDSNKNQKINPEEVTEKLLQGGSAKILAVVDETESEEEKQSRKQMFEKKRKEHYDEYKRAKLSHREKHEQSDEDDDPDEAQPSSSHS